MNMNRNAPKTPLTKGPTVKNPQAAARTRTADPFITSDRPATASDRPRPLTPAGTGARGRARTRPADRNAPKTPLARAAAIAVLASLSLGGDALATRSTAPACSRACVERVKAQVRAEVARRHREHKRRVIAPYRSWLRSTRACESSGNYRTNTGNGFYGAYQFTLDTWHRAGGRGRPDLATPLEQDYRAVVWRLRIGNPHSSAGWPVCG